MISVETFQTLGEASSRLGQNAVYFGGGTLLMRTLNYGEQSFDTMIRSTDPALGRISASGERISIGAGVTMAAIMASPDLGFLAPVARSIGGPAIRAMATVGGNLFAPQPYGDLTVALLALDGAVHLADGSQQDLESFLARRADNRALVQAVSIARPQTRDFLYSKISRVKPKGVSMMSLAAWLPGGGGRVSRPRIALGALAPTPVRAKATEAALEGANLDAAGIRNALQALANDIRPADDPVASAWYRAQVAPVHLRRLLLREGAH